MNPAGILGAALLALLALASNPGAAEVAPLDASISPGAPPTAVLDLRGQGRLTYYFWKIYDVEFHLPAAVPSSEALGEHPRRLTFSYLRAFTAEELGKATTSTIRERQGAVPEAEISAGLAAINALWPSVVVGDRLELLYQPGHGTTVSCNGRVLGMVPGAGFARVLFSIWIGEPPIDGKLRAKLLG